VKFLPVPSSHIKGLRLINKKGKKEMTVCNQEALFDSAHAALVFAFNFSGQHYDTPPLARLAASLNRGLSSSSGKGLTGLDGAAQAGMIRAEIALLGPLAESVLAARFAPSYHPCSCRSACCSGRKTNPEWINAVAWLANHMRSTALFGTSADYRIRRTCVLRHFQAKDRRQSLEQMADYCAITRNTAGAYMSKVAKFLKVIEASAYSAISDRLQEIAVVEHS
jgi:hypothetical protein